MLLDSVPFPMYRLSLSYNLLLPLQGQSRIRYQHYPGRRNVYVNNIQHPLISAKAHSGGIR